MCIWPLLASSASNCQMLRNKKLIHNWFWQLVLKLKEKTKDQPDLNNKFKKTHNYISTKIQASQTLKMFLLLIIQILFSFSLSHLLRKKEVSVYQPKKMYHQRVFAHNFFPFRALCSFYALCSAFCDKNLCWLIAINLSKLLWKFSCCWPLLASSALNCQKLQDKKIIYNWFWHLLLKFKGKTNNQSDLYKMYEMNHN